MNGYNGFEGNEPGDDILGESGGWWSRLRAAITWNGIWCISVELQIIFFAEKHKIRTFVRLSLHSFWISQQSHIRLRVSEFSTNGIQNIRYLRKYPIRSNSMTVKPQIVKRQHACVQPNRTHNSTIKQTDIKLITENQICDRNYFQPVAFHIMVGISKCIFVELHTHHVN